MKDSLEYDPTKKKYEWHLMPVQDLVLMHIKIVDEMTRREMVGIPERVNAFPNSEVGARACQALHARVLENEAGSKKAAAENAVGPTLDPNKDAGGDAVMAHATRKLKRKPAPRAAGKTKIARSKPAETAAEQKEETTVANNGKNGNGAKKKAAKKKKNDGTKKTAGGATRGWSKWPDNAKISVLVDENPRREGTGPHKRFAVLEKAKGKTVAYYREHGGRPDTLARAVKEKLAKVNH